MSGPPERIVLRHQTPEEDPNPGRGRYVGEARDGTLFFITTPFQPSICAGEFAGRDFVALYRWHADGEFQSATIHSVATRDPDSTLPGNALPPEHYEDGIRGLLSDLEPVDFCDIEIAPFMVEISGVRFGLVPQPPDGDDEDWTVTAEPGDYMCFYAPWDGEYDT